MKKAYLLLFLLMLPVFSFAQLIFGNIPVQSELSYVFNANNSVDQKIMNAKTWIATTFGDYNSVIQFEDAASGRIIMKGKSSVKKRVYNTKVLDKTITYYENSQYSFTITFDFKEDKFRLQIGDITSFIGTSTESSSVIPNEQMSLTERLDYIERAENAVISELKTQMLIITSALQRGISKRKDRELLMARYKLLEMEVSKLEEEKPAKIANRKDEVILEYQDVFYAIINSASKKISEKDDF